MERKFKDGFSNIEEELVWEFCKESGGNPYAFQELVEIRNRERDLAHAHERS